jgi:uncharacterized protein (DUF2062 family)
MTQDESMSQKLKDILSSGATPHALALAFACGVSCGNFPIPFLTTLPVLLASFMFGLS